jgi:hypothetical protein
VSRRRILVRAAAPFVAAVVTVVALTFVAAAHDTDLTDPNDTRGKLDVWKVRLAHQPGPPVWTILTFGEWRVHEMWDRGYLLVMLDTQQGPPADHYLLLRSNGSALVGSLWRIRAVGPDSFLGGVPAFRKSTRSASVQVWLGRLAFGEKRRFYRWWVETIVTSETCPRTCQDRAPNGAATVLNWRPGMSPTPSPTPSPSPSGSPST